MIWQIVVVLVLVAANGFFVAAEFALVKVRASEIKHDEAGRERSTRIARQMLDHLCQLGITLAAHT